MDKIIMNSKEREQLVTFKKLADGQISQATAAKMLRVSSRWIRKKFKRYQKEGDVGLVHKGRGKLSSKKWSAIDRTFSLDLLRSDDWLGFGPTFAAEKLAKGYGIKVSRETLRQLMKANGFDYAKRKGRKHRSHRERREVFGLMIQLDGSPHNWFEGRGPACTLLVFIDDATSRILWLEFAESESVNSIMKATQNYFEKFGKPASFYVDFGSVFSVNTNNKDREKITQFERAMEELGVKIIHARSPQAKGRVERCNRTMQDRLVKEMRLAKISNIADVNKFIHYSHFIDEHNAKYAEEAAKQGDAHLPVDKADLYNSLCLKESRVVMQDWTISYDNKILQLLNKKSVLVRPKDHVIVREHLDEKLTISIRKTNLEFEHVGMRKRAKFSPIEYAKMHDAIEDQVENVMQLDERNFSLCKEDKISSDIAQLNQLEKAYLDNLALQALGR